MHQNPFSAGGYDYQDLQRQIQQKADRDEIYSLRSTLDRLESSVRELSAENARLRHRCEVLEESCREAVEQYHADNGQFGVGA